MEPTGRINSKPTRRRGLLRPASIEQLHSSGVQQRKAKFFAPDDPCHQHADSLFSSTSGFKNYRGLLNLCIVLLVLATGRVAIENVLKYGILVDPVIWLHVFVQNPYAWPSFLLVLLVNAFILVSYTLEILLSKRQLGEGLGKLLQVLNLVVLIVFPMVVVLQLHPSASSSSVALVLYTVTFLKLISYLQVNKWCRDEQLSVMTNRRRYKSLSYAETEEVMDNSVKNSDEDSDEDGITFETKVRKKNSANGCVTSLGNTKAKQVYPDNINLKDLYYFMVAPTLCYELDFPRSGRIRKRFLLKRIGEMVFLSGLIMSLCQQWIIPIVHNSYQPFNEMKFFEMLERLLKLSVPNHLIWLIFFYWYFHSCLNVLAEVLMFGDRIFYRDWWNAPTIECFWAKWNVPVHRWCVRHVYKPMLNMGFSKLQGSIFVFAISAFFHEYLVSVPLGMFRYWAFIAMLTQVPLAAFVRRFLDEKNGNIVMWLSVILGQPAAILMYYHDYYILHLLGNSTVDVHS